MTNKNQEIHKLRLTERKPWQRKQKKTSRGKNNARKKKKKTKEEERKNKVEGKNYSETQK